ncbi:virulence factor TspB C-terminal domain-related protein, partial [Nitrosomonas sp. Nm34]|uniref:virulence factor TspB C-terminal domain-related protein n=1 Tax=Nitrosomonas sp. Nm34 TaxID=1881055 RepID=UPI0008E5F83E
GDRFIKVTSGFDYKAANGRNYPVTVEKTGKIDASKIGKAVVKLAKVATPISLGIAFYEVTCELADICKKDDADEWSTNGAPEGYELYPLTTTNNHWRTNTLPATNAPTPKLSCDLAIPLYSQFPDLRYELVGTSHTCRSPQYGFTMYILEQSGCAPHYTLVNGTCKLEGSTQRPPTQQDWNDAETKFNDPRFDVQLIVNGEPIPVNTPSLTSAPPVKLHEEETVMKDDQGNVTGTQKRTTSLTITDSATSANPGSITTTENTTITNYNTSNQITSTTEITNNALPPENDKPKTINVTFDDAQDVVLPTQEIEAPLNTTSWGEGTCPAPISISTSLKDFTIPTQQYCDFATASRPFVLLIAGITALFIITGFNRGQS